MIYTKQKEKATTNLSYVSSMQTDVGGIPAENPEISVVLSGDFEIVLSKDEVLEIIKVACSIFPESLEIAEKRKERNEKNAQLKKIMNASVRA